MKKVDEILARAGHADAVVTRLPVEIDVPEVAGLPQGYLDEPRWGMELESRLMPMAHDVPTGAGFAIFGMRANAAAFAVKPAYGQFTLKAIPADVQRPPSIRFDQDAWRVETHLREGDYVLFEYERGELYLLGFEQRQLTWSEALSGKAKVFEKHLLQRESVVLPPTASALSEQLLRGQSDWLCDLVRRNMNRETLYDQVAALGMLHRLAWPPPDEARAAIARLLAGEPSEAQVAVVAWMQALSPGDLEDLEAEALAALDYVEHELRSLRDEPSDEAGWHRRVLFALHERDTLEGVRELLAAVQAGEALRTGLQALDAFAAELADALPPVEGLLADERLRRAVVCSPDGWWTQLAS